MAGGKTANAFFSSHWISVECNIGHLSQFQDVKLLVEDIGELKPTIFCAVPRVLDRIYSGVLFFLHECAI